jgi:hypothetical protein
MLADENIDLLMTKMDFCSGLLINFAYNVLTVIQEMEVKQVLETQIKMPIKVKE